ncbi:hypothetical protein ACB098_06G073500 [Castanea mollissima]|uniref:OPA3-like protein n=1 Tax=Castanea mollissima TaxID=60419 RepID=A0A8J4R8H0_9ROSI|nr:hypothetical protein CMV_013137 [Castanea mollissima]
MVLPLFKLGTLALRTISKPIANRLKKEAGLHPTFRQFIINIAQANHRFTTTVQRRLYGHATNALIRPLDEGRAVQLASELFGELFVFTVAGILLIYEVHRSSRAEARKEEKRKQEMEALKQKNKDLERELEVLKYRQSAQGRGYLDFLKLWHAGTLEGHKWGRPSYINAM